MAQHFVGYDPEGYSMWFCDYKYTDENTVNFVVMNKVRFLYIFRVLEASVSH